MVCQILPMAFIPRKMLFQDWNVRNVLVHGIQIARDVLVPGSLDFLTLWDLLIRKSFLAATRLAVSLSVTLIP